MKNEKYQISKEEIKEITKEEFFNYLQEVRAGKVMSTKGVHAGQREAEFEKIGSHLKEEELEDMDSYNGYDDDEEYHGYNESEEIFEMGSLDELEEMCDDKETMEEDELSEMSLEEAIAQALQEAELEEREERGSLNEGVNRYSERVTLKEDIQRSNGLRSELSRMKSLVNFSGEAKIL